jgi:hypothetical protein
MALYLLPTHKIRVQHVAPASNKPEKPGFSRRNALAAPGLGEASSAAIFAEPPLTRWDSIKGVMPWM